MPGCGGGTLKNPQYPTCGVDLDLLQANFSMQEIFIGLLHFHLAYVVGAAVVGGVDLLQFLFVDARHVTQQMGGLVLLWVFAQQFGLYVHPRKPVSIDGQPGNLIHGQAHPQREYYRSGDSVYANGGIT